MRIAFLISLLVVTACAPITDIAQPRSVPSSIEDPTPFDRPAEDARTVEEFDTTTDEQRDAAVATAPTGNSLGTTVATLGDASIPGFWLETSLVSAPTTGRVRNPATGRTVQVDLRPSEGGSSRISLAALRLLEAPLTELVTLEVFRNG